MPQVCKHNRMESELPKRVSEWNTGLFSRRHTYETLFVPPPPVYWNEYMKSSTVSFPLTSNTFYCLDLRSPTKPEHMHLCLNVCFHVCLFSTTVTHAHTGDRAGRERFNLRYACMMLNECLFSRLVPSVCPGQPSEVKIWLDNTHAWEILMDLWQEDKSFIPIALLGPFLQYVDYSER